jgi:hypothetical protein
MSEAMAKLFLAGFVGTGKSTFLAALWHVVNGNIVPGALTLKQFHSDNTHLNALEKCWLGAQKVPRTNPNTKKKVEMLLSLDGVGPVVQFTFPDLSGEAFANMWNDRRLDISIKEFLSESDGGLLLVNPEKVKTSELISDLPSSEPGGDGIAAQEYNPKDSPTAVQLVDLLQNLLLINPQRPLNLAVVISAWDLVMNTEVEDIDPQDWIEKRLPLLHQFLLANTSVLNFKAFGVSAQGGEYKDAQRELLANDHPADRILVAEEGKDHSHDITRPIQWLMGLDRIQ